MKARIIVITLFLIQIFSFPFVYQVSYNLDPKAFKVSCENYDERFEIFAKSLNQIGAHYPSIKAVIINELVQKQKVYVSQCSPIPSLSLDQFLKDSRLKFESDQMGFTTYEHFQASLLNIVREHDLLKGPTLYIINRDFWKHSFAQIVFVESDFLRARTSLVQWLEITQRLFIILTYISLTVVFIRKRD